MTVEARTQQKLREKHPELEMRAYDAPDPDVCNEGQTVSSRLNVKLVRSDIESTSKNIIVSCGVRLLLNPIVYAPASAVVYLPLDSTTPTPPTTTTTLTASVGE